jgi:hypothetical protein
MYLWDRYLKFIILKNKQGMEKPPVDGLLVEVLVETGVALLAESYIIDKIRW